MTLVSKDAEQITFEGDEALLVIAMLNHFSLNGFPEGMAAALEADGLSAPHVLLARTLIAVHDEVESELAGRLEG